MFEILLPFSLLVLLLFALFIIWRTNARKYISSVTVASAYDAWTQDKLLERLWGEHIHLGFYPSGKKDIDFRKSKVQFVHELVKWSGLDKLPKNPMELSFWIGAHLGGPVAEEQQRLLEERNTYTRLQREYEMLDHTRKQLAARTALKESFPDIKEN